MAVSATDDPANILISENGIPGENGQNGQDGVGFNSVRKSLIDNPLLWLYGKNALVKRIKNALSVSRTTSGAYTDIYGQAQTASDNTPREEVEGWLFDGDESHSLQVFNNFPDLRNDFSVVLSIGTYSETATNQSVISLQSTTGELFYLGTDASGNWVAKIEGSDTTVYEATTTESATSASEQKIFVTFDSSTGELSVTKNNNTIGAVSVPVGIATINPDVDCTISGSFTLHMQGLRFFDFLLNSEEITYLS